MPRAPVARAMAEVQIAQRADQRRLADVERTLEKRQPARLEHIERPGDLGPLRLDPGGVALVFGARAALIDHQQRGIHDAVRHRLERQRRPQPRCRRIQPSRKSITDYSSLAAALRARCATPAARYLENPDEFIFNGTHGKLAAGGNRRKSKPSGFRIIHRPGKGKPGARISVSLDHQAQKELRDNVRILRCIVNGDSITTMRRVLADPDTGKQIGVSRLYSRIFWLEKTLLAFERAKLKEWKQRVEASGRFSHMRIAHDDVTISVNWESRLDRRLTPLQFSVSADIRSGYVVRIDANFDPNVDPVEFIQEHYLDSTGQPKNFRQHYSQKSGVTFTAPKMHFQRPSGRLDEAMPFASAEGRWRVFSERVQNAYEKTVNAGFALPPEVQEKIAEADAKRYQLDQNRQGYFHFHDTDRDFRGSFNGSVVRRTCTRVAHLACLRAIANFQSRQFPQV